MQAIKIESVLFMTPILSFFSLWRRHEALTLHFLKDFEIVTPFREIST